VKIAGNAQELNVVMSGVADDPPAAQSEVISALLHAGFANANADFSAIAPIEPGGCSALNAYRQIPRAEPPRLTTPQLVWDMHVLKNGDYKGQLGAQPIITVDVGDPKLDLTLIGIAPSGVIDKLLDNRAYLESAVAQNAADIVKLPNGAYRLKMDINHQGWSGLALITGKGPFPADVVRPGLGERNIAWQNRFATMAEQHGWKADMLWFRVENQRAGD
jgi:serine/threonine-protein kinase